jgi:hypothetical protein
MYVVMWFSAGVRCHYIVTSFQVSTVLCAAILICSIQNNFPDVCVLFVKYSTPFNLDLLTATLNKPEIDMKSTSFHVHKPCNKTACLIAVSIISLKFTVYNLAVVIKHDLFVLRYCITLSFISLQCYF